MKLTVSQIDEIISLENSYYKGLRTLELNKLRKDSKILELANDIYAKLCSIDEEFRKILYINFSLHDIIEKLILREKSNIKFDAKIFRSTLIINSINCKSIDELAKKCKLHIKL